MQYNEWDSDLIDSIKAMDSIKDTILPRLISGKIHSVEGGNSALLSLLDTSSGIDYIRQDDHGLQGIAARVQWGNNWNTFTIRSNRHTGSITELEKRVYQIENRYFYPEYTLQAYFNNRVDNTLLSIGIIKTIDLYNLFKSDARLFSSRKSDNEFFYIHWDEINKIKKERGIGFRQFIASGQSV